jgi:hypothetical protein
VTNIERALQLWPMLVAAAHDRRLLTYGLVAEQIGMPPVALGTPLGILMRYCAANDLPPLTVVVVNKESGLPGEGLTTLTDLPSQREHVFEHGWYRRLPPSQADLAPFESAPVTATTPAPSEPTADLTGSLSGERLNRVWNVGAAHALYHYAGEWYHRLQRFPGAFFDLDGYVRFETREEYERCPELHIGRHVNVRAGIKSIPGYTRVRVTPT